MKQKQKIKSGILKKWGLFTKKRDRTHVIAQNKSRIPFWKDRKLHPQLPLLNPWFESIRHP